MIKKILSILQFFINLTLFLSISLLITQFVWQNFGWEYTFGATPIGGDYFNALTYLMHITKHLPFPPTGWFSFANEGVPVIGGYPIFAFYIIIPLIKYFDTAIALNLFSIASLILFFIASLLTFWHVSKNWIFAVGATITIIETRATYNQLAAGGYIVSASSQWYLPITLLFIYFFFQKASRRFLVLAGISSGLALLHHAPTSFLIIFLPSVLMISFFPSPAQNLKIRLKNLALFIIMSVLIGSTGIYSLYLQNFQGAGTDACTSAQCWGIYPLHFNIWLNVVSPVLAFTFISLAVLLKIFRRTLPLKFILPAILGFSVIFLYCLAAYLHLINGSANVIPPTRIFWAANFYLLLIAASSFFTIQKIIKWFAYLPAITASIFSAYFFVNHPLDVFKYTPNTVPADAVKYTVPPYQSQDPSKIIPDWITLDDQNWRIDIMNQGIIHWWNIVSQLSQVRGYSNNPLGIHRDWQYFLQASTRNPDEQTDKELVTNRALFLIDAFGIGYTENSLASYPKTILNDGNFITNYTQIRDLIWYKLSDKITSPIVSPTIAPAILFVGDNKGYENFIRSIAMMNLNSKVLIPIKGPTSINDLASEDLKTFTSIILYQYQGDDFKKLERFVKDGGNLFINTSWDYLPKNKLPKVFPIESLTTKESSRDETWQKQTDAIVKDIDLQKFSQLSFQGGPWKFSFATRDKLRPWSSSYLELNNQIVVAGGTLEKGTIIWSGLNLPFHIVDNNNYEEAKLFANILNQLIKPSNSSNVIYQIERQRPEKIIVTAQKASGIYFKENYDNGWTAKINNKKTRIYKAGLEFMYIPIKDSEVNAQIEYKGNLITWTLFITSLSSLIILVTFIILPNRLLRITKNINNKISKKLSRFFFKITEDEL